MDIIILLGGTFLLMLGVHYFGVMLDHYAFDLRVNAVVRYWVDKFYPFILIGFVALVFMPVMGIFYTAMGNTNG